MTGSTNADLSALAAAGEAAGLVLVAGEQTAGRGRLGRAWVAPAGSALTFSVLLRPAVPANRLGWLPLVCGLAVVDAVRAATGSRSGSSGPTTCWPASASSAASWSSGSAAPTRAVAGIGLNVAMTADQLPVPAATSLAVELAPPPPRRSRSCSPSCSTASRSGARRGSPAPTSRPTTALPAARSGRPVRVEVPAGPALTGTARDVDVDGRLLVQTVDGVVAVAAGDVVHVR